MKSLKLTATGRGAQQQPWLNAAVPDLLFILSPPFFSLLVVFLFPDAFKHSDMMPVAYWVILVVFIDVAHVYSTLYRTYFNPRKQRAYVNLLITVPLTAYVVSVFLYFTDPLLFWRLLAYLAVFHFIRQQYGFMRLYARKEQQGRLFRLIDTIAIYAATIFPILYWHFDAHRNFSWFIKGDFILYPSNVLLRISTICYILTVCAYVFKEIYAGILMKMPLNIPRNLLVAGTCLSWYFGIVYFNGDMAFTLLNVISHGIPYMALIWFFEKEQIRGLAVDKHRFLHMLFQQYGILLFLGSLFLFAYLEEGLWDGLIWRERRGTFPVFSKLPQIQDMRILSLLVPLLALPQITHYVLDGFIWKRKLESTS